MEQPSRGVQRKQMYYWFQFNLLEMLIVIYLFRGGYRTVATSKMELFVIIVNGFQPLTIITKCSILDVAAVLDLPLFVS